MIMRLIFALVLMLSALSLVTARYQARQLYMETERLTQQAQELEVEWRRLQAERASLASNARIDTLARQDLNLIGATSGRTIHLRLPAVTGGAQ